MKTKLVIVTCILFGRVIAVSPNDINLPQLDLDQIEKAYVISLGYDNIGVVESALYCVVTLHYEFPHRDFRRIKEAVDDLSMNSETPLIRYKANVAKMYLNNPTLMNRLTKEDFKDGSDFWAMLVRINKLCHIIS